MDTPSKTHGHLVSPSQITPPPLRFMDGSLYARLHISLQSGAFLAPASVGTGGGATWPGADPPTTSSTSPKNDGLPAAPSSCFSWQSAHSPPQAHFRCNTPPWLGRTGSKKGHGTPASRIRSMAWLP